MLQIYNSLTKQKELFKPIKPNYVGMYVCGVTTYDYCHVGHARVYVVFDIIIRYLRSQGFEVKYVRNITDIDDKIIRRAQENDEAYELLTERFIQAMQEDFAKLNILPPDEEPRATAHIPEIITMINNLIEKDYAYVASNGDVCYRVRKFKNYGQLAHKDLQGLRSGARVEVADSKQDPLDFVLWKVAKPGEPQWDCPWGPGRPGWHIECSAMATDCLGNNFDIHGGGFDLQFPHHENEIAQAEAATDERFVNTWMHVGFVQVNKEKMSKSLGNFFTIREVLAKYKPEVVRYFLLASHYRSQINYSQESLDFAAGALERFYKALRGLPQAKAPKDSEYEQRFNATMNDDFNTPEALAVLFEMTHEIHRLREQDAKKASELAALLRKLAGVLGILEQDPETYFQGDIQNSDAAEIERLIERRNQARSNKDWAESDRVRDELINKGIVLEDNPNGTTWRYKERARS